MKYLDEFAQLIIDKLENFEGSWKKPWIDINIPTPENLKGKKYLGLNNQIYLNLICQKYNYKTPIFLTFNDAKALGAMINTGAKAVYINYVKPNYQDKDTKEYISKELYNQLTESEQENYEKKFLYKEYPVFNIDQTNLQEINPNLYEKLEKRISQQVLELKCDERLLLDIQKNWCCSIDIGRRNQAYYSPSEDIICVPMLEQFKGDVELYSILLHEMVHSTGHKSRLNRFRLGNEEYAKEELVAEISSAFIGQQLGVSTTINENNIAYIKSWLSALQNDKNYINEVLGDIKKAVDYTLTTLKIELKKEIVEDIDINSIKLHTGTIEQTNTKHNKDMYIARFDSSFEKEEWKKIVELAIENGGRYNKKHQGIIFFEASDLNRFVNQFNKQFENIQKNEIKHNLSKQALENIEKRLASSSGITKTRTKRRKI